MSIRKQEINSDVGDREPVNAGMSRRSLLSGVAAASVVGAVTLSGPLGEAAASNRMKPGMIAMSGDDWTSLQGQSFSISAGNRQPLASVRLEEVTLNSGRGRDSGRPKNVRPGSVLLIMTSDQQFEDGMFTVAHKDAGQVELFVHGTVCLITLGNRSTRSCVN